MIRIIAVMPCIITGAFCMTLLHAAEDNLILSNVWLNQVDRDTEVLVFEQDQQLYAECSVLKQLKVKVELMSRSGRKPEFCLLTAAGIKSELDSSLQAVKIELPGNYFEAQSLSESPLLMPDKARAAGNTARCLRLACSGITGCWITPCWPSMWKAAKASAVKCCA